MFGTNSKKYRDIILRGNEIKNTPYNIEIANLGSTVSYYDFDYEIIGKRGANFALPSQTLYYDYQILQKYIDHLSNDAYVCICICHFTFLVYQYKNERTNLKYYNILNNECITGYNKFNGFLWDNFPMFLMPSLIKDSLLIEKIKIGENNYTAERDIFFAKQWLDGWKKEFQWLKGYELRVEQFEIMEKVYTMLKQIIDFCRDNQKNPVLVLPPISQNLKEILPKQILDDCFWVYIDKLKKDNNIIIDLFNDDEICNYDNFCDALKLNEKGKHIFNKKIMEILYER